jgi:hypothetical protein
LPDGGTTVPVSMSAGAYDHERTARFDVAGGAEEALRPLERVAVDARMDDVIVEEFPDMLTILTILDMMR